MGKSYSLNAPKKRRTRMYGLIALLFVGIIGVGVYAYVRFRIGDTGSYVVSSSDEHTAPETPIQPAPEAVEGRYMFSGTIVLARAVETYANGDYSQPFSGFHTFKPSQYDGWLADLECPVTANQVSYQRQVDDLIFNCGTEWLPELSKHIKFLNLANNHTNDMGTDGFLETQKNLDTAGFQIVGNYRPTETEDNCEVMALPVRLQLSDDSEQDAQLPVAFCAFHYFSFSPSPGELEEVRSLSKIMPVFSFMHVGIEYLAEAKGSQVEIAHKLIDYGSEFVIGNSPHWVQNSEAYKGKLIVYSTGNFIFDQLETETNRGLNMDITFSAEYNDNLQKWLELASQCAKRNDDCAKQAQEQALKKYDLTYTYAPVASLGGAGVVTKKADAATQRAVESRLNWLDTLNALNQ